MHGLKRALHVKKICQDAMGQPAWDANSVYAIGVLLEHPAGSGDLWIAIAPSTTAGVEPGEPWADGNEWELCGPEDNTSGGPCGGLDYVGVWDDLSRVSTGEIYEYQAALKLLREWYSRIPRPRSILSND